jgi:antitoxin (DNA-binding transcriptional repressor) of toxin-antitoxin stability system
VKTVELADATETLSAYARKVRREPLVVTRRGKPVLALIPLSCVDRESLKVSTSPTFIAIMERSRARALQARSRHLHRGAAAPSGPPRPSQTQGRLASVLLPPRLPPADPHAFACPRAGPGGPLPGVNAVAAARGRGSSATVDDTSSVQTDNSCLAARAGRACHLYRTPAKGECDTTTGAPAGVQTQGARQEVRASTGPAAQTTA